MTEAELHWWEEPAAPELAGLRPYIIRKLVAANITTREQIEQVGERQLLRIDGIGHRAVERIKQWLREQHRQGGAQ